LKNRAIRIGVLGLAALNFAQAQSGGFGGPSILSRGGGGLGGSRGQAIGISAYGSVQGIYNWGFTPIDQATASTSASSTSIVTVPRLSGGGVLLDGGLIGYYKKQRHSTSFAVRSLYANNSSGNAFNNYGLNLEFAHTQQINRKTTAFVSLGAGKTNYTGQFLYRFTEEPVAQTVSPGYEIFDNHLTTVSGAAGITYQKSARWSFSAQGGVFGADRKEHALADTRGTSASGSTQYSFSRKTSAGLSYSYSWYFFPGNFGETRSHSGQVFLNRTFGRRWSASVRGGTFEAFTERLTAVPLDPLIASITGQLTGLQIYRKSTIGWVGGADVTARFRNSSVEATYGRSLQAGNGIYLTSVSDVGTLRYMYQARRAWNMSLFGSYSKLGALTQQLGSGGYQTAGGSYSHRINSFMSAVGSAGYFHTSVFSGRFARDRIYVSAGIQFAPHDLPILR